MMVREILLPPDDDGQKMLRIKIEEYARRKGKRLQDARHKKVIIEILFEEKNLEISAAIDMARKRLKRSFSGDLFIKAWDVVNGYCVDGGTGNFRTG